MKTIRNILKEKGNAIYSIGPKTKIIDALKKMAEKNIGAILVIENDKILGIFSERDYARKSYQSESFSLENYVEDFMSKEIVTISQEGDIFECMSIMTKRKIRHLPVLDENKIIGIVSIGDIVNSIIHHQEATIKDLEKYITGGYVNIESI
ncbi:MAG: CBS domain-containing protein [Bacteroidales bacterium]|jgi:CBS domain-containing protein